MRTALITGISGQDGVFLTSLLKENGFLVVGTSRSISSFRTKHFKSRFPDVPLVETDCHETDRLCYVFQKYNPNYVFNLAGMSSVNESFKNPYKTESVNVGYLESLILAIKKSSRQNEVRLLQASSSEMFGETNNLYCDESTPFKPVSPYGKSKVEAHELIKSVRVEGNGIFASNAILFNHESELRDNKFLVAKICDFATRQEDFNDEPLTVADKSVIRDWGFAGDYAHAMLNIIEHEIPTDLVVATGIPTSVEQLARVAFEVSGRAFIENESLVEDHSLKRPRDPHRIVGNPTRIRKLLEWKHNYGVRETVSRIIDYKKTSNTAINQQNQSKKS
jgi:GDPmannose 4,6-dehydratase